METPPLNPLPPPPPSHMTPMTGLSGFTTKAPTPAPSSLNEPLLADLRKLTLSALSSDSPRQAQFYADKLVAAANGGWYNGLLLARSHAAVGELRRAVLCLETMKGSGGKSTQTLLKSKTPQQPHAHVGGFIYHEKGSLGSALLGKRSPSSSTTPLAPSHPVAPIRTTAFNFNDDSPTASPSPADGAPYYPPAHLCVEAAIVASSSLIKVSIQTHSQTHTI